MAIVLLTHALDVRYADGGNDCSYHPSRAAAEAEFAAISGPKSEVLHGSVRELEDPIEHQAPDPEPLALVPDMAAEVAAMKAAQALRILETLNAADRSFHVRRLADSWQVEFRFDGANASCFGATLTDALAQFASAVGLE